MGRRCEPHAVLERGGSATGKENERLEGKKENERKEKEICGERREKGEGGMREKKEGRHERELWRP